MAILYTVKKTNYSIQLKYCMVNNSLLVCFSLYLSIYNKLIIKELEPLITFNFMSAKFHMYSFE